MSLNIFILFIFHCCSVSLVQSLLRQCLEFDCEHILFLSLISALFKLSRAEVLVITLFSLLIIFNSVH